MRWASGRETTREEDIAYCLLGLFNVNMPLLYGEGPKAFQRLQEEIVRNEDDYTILAWPGGNADVRSKAAISALAESPAAFAGPLSFPANISVELQEKLAKHAWGHLRSHKIKRKSYTPPVIVSLGLLLRLPVRIIETNPGFKRFLVSTECAIHLDGRVMVLCIELRADNHTYIDDLVIMQRVPKNGPIPSRLHPVDEADLADMDLMRMYLPRPRDWAPSPGLGRQPTRPNGHLIQLLLPAPPNPSLRVTVINTFPDLWLTTAPPGLRDGTQPPDAGVYHLNHRMGVINISVAAPGEPRFGILYRDATAHGQPASCLVIPFQARIPTYVENWTALGTFLADEVPHTDRTARSFPEHGLQIRASIKPIPVDVGDDDVDGGNGCEGGGPIGICFRVAIDACLLDGHTEVVMS